MRKIFFLWLAWGLLGFYFHEAWRDEAQAWLVAKSAVSVKDLFFLSSLEATPPVYYVLLWPWAKLNPGGFLWLQWVVSFAGTAGAVWLILKSKIFNSPLVRILLSF